ncbi:MAG: aminopeptidase [Planctomycetaceae bacterium]|nr:aminopeptidase [Planctomycetaceae bacterium]
MPDPPPVLTDDESDVAERLSADVDMLATQIGDRNVVRNEALTAARRYVEQRFDAMGYACAAQLYQVGDDEFANIEVERAGRRRDAQMVIVGAHYDTERGVPGANDNATGIAGLLAIAGAFAESDPQVTVRFVAFANEERPYFQTEGMGSWVYAARCRERDEQIAGMIALDTVGYYTSRRDVQRYPPVVGWSHPRVGNYMGLLSNWRSRGWTRRVHGLFRAHSEFPSDRVIIPCVVPRIGWSDDWSFWRFGYRALCVTDTAFLRYRYYHTIEDTADKIDIPRMAQMIVGLRRVVAELIGASIS